MAGGAAIQVDIDDLGLIVELAGFGPAGLSDGVAKVAHIARTHLVMLAQRELSTSARDYVKGIQPVELATDGPKFVAIVGLHGALPNMVEHGRGAWDLRNTVFTAKNTYFSKAGHAYAFIPFRHMGPNASGKNAPAVGSAHTQAGKPPASRAYRGQMDQAQARVMGRAVWKAAKKLAPTTSSPGGGVSYGEQLKPETGGATLLRPRHATDVYAGMYRQEKHYETKTQDSFASFRTISTNPDTFREDDAGGKMERNWTHPGIEARHLIPQTMEYMNKLASAGVFGG